MSIPKAADLAASTPETRPTTPGSRVWGRRADAFNPPGRYHLWLLVTDPDFGPLWRCETTGYETAWQNLVDVHVDHVAPPVSLDPAEREKTYREVVDCTCVENCAEHPPTACSLSGILHVHPDDGSGTFGPCPVHPDAPGDH